MKRDIGLQCSIKEQGTNFKSIFVYKKMAFL